MFLLFPDLFALYPISEVANVRMYYDYSVHAILLAARSFLWYCRALSYYADDKSYVTHPLSPLKPALDLTKYEVIAPPGAVDRMFEVCPLILIASHDLLLILHCWPSLRRTTFDCLQLPKAAQSWCYAT